MSTAVNAPLTDFAYSALLVLSILSGNSGRLVSHIDRLFRRAVSVLRAMRNHDGILMKTSLFGPDERRRLVAAFAEYGIPPRIIEKRQYEFNCSFPYVCSLGMDVEGMWRRIRAATTLTACLPGVCYIYLPILFGFRPELDRKSVV